MPDALAIEQTHIAVKQALEVLLTAANHPYGEQQPTLRGRKRASSLYSPRPEPFAQHVRPRRGRYRCSDRHALSANCCWRCEPRQSSKSEPQKDLQNLH